MSDRRVYLRFYDRWGKRVPEERGVCATETVVRYRGGRDTSRILRYGWLLSEPEKLVQFETRKKRDHWLATQTGLGPYVRSLLRPARHRA
jgi:hypothetical protein